MPGKVVFNSGDPHELEGKSVSDRRLIDRLGRTVTVVEHMRPVPPHLVVHIKSMGTVYGKIAEISYGQTMTGDELNLPLVEQVSHIPNKELE